MKAEDLEGRLRTGEDSRTEFKSVRAGLPSVDDIAKEISALANSGGGDVLFGVSDDAVLEGVGTVKDAERVQRQIVQACADAITPPIRVTTLVVEVQGSLVVVAHAPGHLPERPFRGRTKYFLRDGNVTREARPQELKQLLAPGATRYFDEQTVHGAAATDLDDALIDTFLASSIPNAQATPRDLVLRSLKVIDEDGVPTYAGILFLGRDPQGFLRDAYLSIVQIDGTRFGDPRRDMKELRGPVSRQLEQCVEYLELHVPRPFELEGERRRETGVPVEVWREAVANALAHRDYQIASQTRVFVFDDRVEIANPGELLNRLTIDGIRLGGISQRRNPCLAALLARARQRESLGIGVPAMLQIAEDAGFPSPEIRVGNGEFRLTVRTRPKRKE